MGDRARTKKIGGIFSAVVGGAGESYQGTMIQHVRRRLCPLAVTITFVGLGLAYFFRWGPLVRHEPSLWVTPGDLMTTYNAANAFTHGHFGAVYGPGVLALPGFLVLLAPLGSLSNSAPHPQALVFLAPYALLLACAALFACDAMAERLGVTPARRALLCVVEGVLLWNVVVLWGHPEDALAVALALYAVMGALDGRWVRAGWLLGAALAIQPLVVVIVPIILFMGGREHAWGLALRGVVPPAVVTLPPLLANFHRTVHAIVTQPAYLFFNHQTPWTSLAPKLGGVGPAATVGGGPMRVVALILAVALGWWARRWRDSPEMIVGAVAIGLALRCYTESVMTSYYVWPALAVGVVVAARRSAWSFGLALIAAVFTTVAAQWRLGEYPWWGIDVAGVTVVLIAAVRQNTVTTVRGLSVIPKPGASC
jgi:hypothetical protein